MPDFTDAFARRARLRGGGELSTILAGSPPGVLSMTGGFPNPTTFPARELDELAARLVREDAAVALQYTPVAGLPSVREHLIERQERLQGRRPDLSELIVTSELANAPVVQPPDRAGARDRRRAPRRGGSGRSL